MNRKGFTLVEILVVIAITALLVLILIPNIFIIIDKNKEKSCSSILKNIESAAKIYVTNNKYNMGFGCNSPNNTKNVTVQELIDTGDLTIDSKGKIINPINEKEISLDNSRVIVTYNCNEKEFTYDLDIKDKEGNIAACN